MALAASARFLRAAVRHGRAAARYAAHRLAGGLSTAPVGDVRQCGMAAGIELVKGESGEPYAWEERIDLARKDGRIGDVLVLADEAPVAAFRAEAWIKAGEALRKAERFV
ncbi:MAG: hypothetical protein HGA47_12945, partial [Zoogloea sp.]|nr:hypothetical protein [Zoogloea sp.]